jgi:hypothetical protein
VQCSAAWCSAASRRAGRLGKEEKACFFALPQKKKHAFLFRDCVIEKSMLIMIALSKKACFYSGRETNDYSKV